MFRTQGRWHASSSSLGRGLVPRSKVGGEHESLKHGKVRGVRTLSWNQLLILSPSLKQVCLPGLWLPSHAWAEKPTSPLPSHARAELFHTHLNWPTLILVPPEPHLFHLILPQFWGNTVLVNYAMQAFTSYFLLVSSHTPSCSFSCSLSALAYHSKGSYPALVFYYPCSS